MQSVVQDALRLVRHDPRTRGVQVQEDYDPETPPVFVVEDHLMQVVLNLLLNAFDATREGGHVKLSVEQQPTTVDVHIDDDGPGVPVEQLDRIFEPFFTTKSTGSGLGLPITHTIITQHGGTMSVSRAPLGGARFTVCLPRAPNQA